MAFQTNVQVYAQQYFSKQKPRKRVKKVFFSDKLLMSSKKQPGYRHYWITSPDLIFDFCETVQLNFS